MGIHELVTNEEDINLRLDVYLTQKFPDFSRSYVQKLIEEENVKINGKIKKSNYRLSNNEKIEIFVPEAIALEAIPEDIPLDILYEDEHLIVVNKAQGMVVHPAHGNLTGTLVNALLFHCGTLSNVGTELVESDDFVDSADLADSAGLLDSSDAVVSVGSVDSVDSMDSMDSVENASTEHVGGFKGINGVLRPGIVHRIDKDTSGVLVVAKTNEAHVGLSEQLKEHTMTRIYIALVEGRIKTESGTIETLIGRSKNDRKKMDVLNRSGRLAITHYKVIELFEHYTLIEAKLETGRTHQIRVHMAHIGHPLVGDLVYGYKKQKIKSSGQLLHAKVLGFIHPILKKYMEFEAPMPEYFLKTISGLNKV